MSETEAHYIGRQDFETPNADATLDVIFIHGLGGNSNTTWSFTQKADGYWPTWLANDLENTNVWVVEYESRLTSTLSGGAGASIYETSTMLLDFAIAKGLGKRPAVFICHSLGGLLVKQMLRLCSDSTKPDYKAFLNATKGIVFLSTPHNGSKLAASIANILSTITSSKIDNLSYGQEQLLDLGKWFSNWAGQNSISVSAYCESKKTNGVHIVDKVTGDPHVTGCAVVSVDTDHFGICKPSNQAAHVYASALYFVKHCFPVAICDGIVLPNSPSDIIATIQPLGKFELLSFDNQSSILSREDGLSHMSVDINAGELLESIPSALSDELATDYEFYTTEAPGNRRSLEEKLRDGKRSHELSRAVQSKERFAKSLHRHIAQPSSLTRYIHLLSTVATSFNRIVYPAIIAGNSSAIVNKLVQREVIEASVVIQAGEQSEMTATTAEGALFYLTGNCHVRWDDAEA